MDNAPRPDLARLIEDLGRRSALGRTVATISMTPELLAAGIGNGAANIRDAQISDITVRCGDNTIAVSMRVQVKAQAWPPRPSIDTQASVQLGQFSAQPDGSIECIVERPLEFTSALADLLAGLAGKLLPQLPLPGLRTRGARVSLDTRRLLAGFAPGLAGADRLRAFAIRVAATAVTLEVGFSA